MYDELVKDLRDCAKVNSLSLYKRGLMKQAADAIEELAAFKAQITDGNFLYERRRAVCGEIRDEEGKEELTDWLREEGLV